MPDSYFSLSLKDRRDALGVAASNSGRPADLLEKDVWVVWTLAGLFAGDPAKDLTFKGGTSLSKGYGVIRRFSEDIDITYDIRVLLPDETGGQAEAIPRSRNQMERWTRAVRKRLPSWVERAALPMLRDHLAATGVNATITSEGTSVYVRYDRVSSPSTEYVGPVVRVEFGGRSTGEPSQPRRIVCDAAEHLAGVAFPVAVPSVMVAERTFWEKATSAHAYCFSGKLRAERYSRHWYDLVRLEQTGFAKSALLDRPLAEAVAQHKAFFFRQTGADGTPISYQEAVKGRLQLEPQGEPRDRLADDYARMAEAGLFEEEAVPFDSIMAACRALQEDANRVATEVSAE